jgi:hypothetical protein
VDILLRFAFSKTVRTGKCLVTTLYGRFISLLLRSGGGHKSVTSFGKGCQIFVTKYDVVRVSFTPESCDFFYGRPYQPSGPYSEGVWFYSRQEHYSD